MQVQNDQPLTTMDQQSPTNTTPLSPVQLLAHSNLLLLVEWYYTPTLVWLGTLGNCLAVYVLLRTKQLHKLSSSHYLAALAASDTVQLQLIFLVWSIVLGADLLNRKVLCEMMQYLMAVTSFLSVWFVLAFTAERFVAVKYPFKSKYLCTVSNARAIIASLTAIALVIYSPILLFAEAEERTGKLTIQTTDDEVDMRNETVLMEIPSFETLTICSVSSKWTMAYVYFNMADAAIACQVPVIAIIILNVFICKHVFWFSRIHKRLVNNGSSPDNTGSRNLNNDGVEIVSRHDGSLTVGAGPVIVSTRTKKSSYKLTKMLLIVSTVCLMLSLPSYIMRVLIFQLNVEGDAYFAELQHWATVIYNINFGINFLLYCVSGQNFRKAAKTVLCPHRNNNKREHSESHTHSTGSSAKKRMNPLHNTISTSVAL